MRKSREIVEQKGKRIKQKLFYGPLIYTPKSCELLNFWFMEDLNVGAGAFWGLLGTGCKVGHACNAVLCFLGLWGLLWVIRNISSIFWIIEMICWKVANRKGSLTYHFILFYGLWVFLNVMYFLVFLCILFIFFILWLLGFATCIFMF